MKVYVVECGCYAERYIEGVYASVEAAIEANPIPNSPCHFLGDREPGWRQDRDGFWTNNLDWGESAEIMEFELIEQQKGVVNASR